MDAEKRSFTVGGDVYYINSPSAADIRNSDWNYSKVYSKSLIEGIYTASEMRDILKKRGIIGPEYDKRAQELSDMLESAITKMYTSGSDEEQRVSAEEAGEIRNEIFQWNHRLNGPMSNTCEQIADDAKLEFLTSCIISSDKDELLWKDYDVFLNETNQALSTRAKFEVMLYLQGLEPDFLETVPEAIVLKDIDEKEKTDKDKEPLDKSEADTSGKTKTDSEEKKKEVVEDKDKPIKETESKDKETKDKAGTKKKTSDKKVKK
jgi:hypothetical protein